MTAAERDKLLIETHAYVRELKIIVTGTNGGGHEKRINDIESVEQSLMSQVSDIRATMVTRPQCEAVQTAIKVRGRSRWIVAKDVVLILLPTATLLTKLMGIW
jgi:hypothetical protein